MIRLDEAWQDEENGIVLVKAKDGGYITFVSTRNVSNELRRYRIRNDLDRLVSSSLNKMLKFMKGNRV